MIFILVAGFSPIPYKIVAIASGMTGFNILFFILTSIVGRGARFFLLATLIYFYGDSINQILKKYVRAIAYIFIALIAIYIAYRVLFF